MKKDYTYIVLFDEVTTRVVRDIQAKLSGVFGFSEYPKQWQPHITVSFGNLLTDEELSEVRKELQGIAQDFSPFQLKFNNYQINQREINGNSFFSLRLKLAPNPELDVFSERVREVAKNFETPFDVFTKDHYHVGLGRYARSDLDDEKIKEIITIDTLPEVIIRSFSIFHSMENTPKPEKATEIERFNFVS